MHPEVEAPSIDADEIKFMTKNNLSLLGLTTLTYFLVQSSQF